MNPKQLSRIVLHGFKSIKECDISLHNLNVLIGSNGSGKSNFISFFQLIEQMLQNNLQVYISKQGGPDSFLYFGRKRTEQLDAELYFGDNGYQFSIAPTNDNRMVFLSENFWWKAVGKYPIGSGHFETNAEAYHNTTQIYNYVPPSMKSWRLYHFHDTSNSALVKQRCNISDNDTLRSDARNLAAYLFRLQKNFPIYYQRIVKTVQLVAPFFGDFYLHAHFDNSDQIELAWTEKGADTPFKAYHLSDGTLRFICLATVLLQPEILQPETILIDEPELGLHPYAIQILASLLRSAATQKQLIVSTQSVTLLNEFSLEDIIVADRTSTGSTLSRLKSDRYQEWLNEYSLGELWQKNLLGGRPS